MGTLNAGGDAYPHVRGMIAKHDLDIMAVNEAHNARPALRDLADLLDYRRIHHTRRIGSADAADTAVLIKPGPELRKLDPLEMTEPWWWGKTSSRLREREPRLLPRFEYGGWLVIVLHNVPDPDGGPGRTKGRNVPAGNELLAAVIAAARGREHVVIVGDFNLEHGQVVRLLGRPLDADVIRLGKVTHAVVVGGVKDSKTNLPERDGQHSRAVTTIEKKETYP